MATLILGFVCLVLVPAIVLAIILNRFTQRAEKSLDKKDDFKVTM
jgi:hypothetical protein